MNLRRTLAFIFTPAREVVETRDRLFLELELANARISEKEKPRYKISNLISTIQSEYDFCINADEIIPQPGIGWAYDSIEETFSLPQVEEFELGIDQKLGRLRGERNKKLSIFKIDFSSSPPSPK